MSSEPSIYKQFGMVYECMRAIMLVAALPFGLILGSVVVVAQMLLKATYLYASTSIKQTRWIKTVEQALQPTYRPMSRFQAAIEPAKAGTKAILNALIWGGHKGLATASPPIRATSRVVVKTVQANATVQIITAYIATIIWRASKHTRRIISTTTGHRASTN